MTQPDWKLDHLAHAVADIDQGIAFYQQLSTFRLVSREIVADQMVEVAFLDAGTSLIELISPSCPESSVRKFLDRYSEGLHHICFEVQDITKELKRLENNSIQLVDTVPRTGAAGHKIAFLHPNSCRGVLIELCQANHQS